MRALTVFMLAAISCTFAQETAAERPRPGDELLAFTLDETPADVATRLGAPAHTGAFGPGYFSWFYQIGVEDLHDFSHTLCFREPDRKLISITRDFAPEVDVDHLFPGASSEVHYWPDREKPQYRVRVRRLPGDRVLLAMGSQAGQPCGQVILIRRSAVGLFFPWIKL
jgi:hypothetical protein